MTVPKDDMKAIYAILKEEFPDANEMEISHLNEKIEQEVGIHSNKPLIADDRAKQQLNTIGELQRYISIAEPSTPLRFQVVDQAGDGWIMSGDIVPVKTSDKDEIVVTLSHPMLKKLPLMGDDARDKRHQYLNEIESLVDKLQAIR